MQRTSSRCPSVPVYRSSAVAKSVAISSTVILFCVSVPVLSEQIQVQLPSVCTAESLRMTAFAFAMRCTPMARVTTAPMPSGIAATATATAFMTFCKKLTRFERIPPKKSTAATDKTEIVMILPSFATSLSRGDATVSV